jgi:hypothetical protein
MLTEAGFAEPAFHGWTGYFTSSYTQGGLISARKPVARTAAEGGGMAVRVATD